MAAYYPPSAFYFRVQLANGGGEATPLAAAFQDASGLSVEMEPETVAEGGVTTDVLLDSGATEREIRALMAEVIAAGRSLGLDLRDDMIDYNINRTRPMGPYRTSSMIDFLAGREVEVTPIWEEPLRQALAAGCPMPHTADLLRRIREIVSRK